jgi:hypothetical protein
MATRLATKKLATKAARDFLNSMSATDSSTQKKSTILYTVLGKDTEYANEPTPDDVLDNVEVSQIKVRQESIGAKKVNATDVSLAIPRYDWVQGTVYAMYRDIDQSLHTRNFYVITRDNNVYKCLNNNSNNPSLYEPRGYDLSPFTSADGYTWKYMYTVNTGDADKFLTTQYIPVKERSVSDGSVESDRQLEVQNASVNGAIEMIELNNEGIRYLQVANGAVIDATALSVTLSPVQGAPEPTNDIYNGSSLYITSGTGAGQLRRIIRYDGNSKQCVVNTAFTTIPQNDSTVVISPTVTIIGDGTGAKAYASVGVDGVIANVNLVSIGQNYTKADIIITANAQHGIGASANAIISPINGHGSNPAEELFADKIVINTQFSGTEGVAVDGKGYIQSNTDFRTISLLADPMLKVDENNEHIETEVVANTSNSPQTLRLTNILTMTYDETDGDVILNPLNIGDTITTEAMLLRAQSGDLEFVTELSPSVRRDQALSKAVQASNGHVVFTKRDLTRDSSFYNIYINNVRSYSNYAPFVKDDDILKSTSETVVGRVVDVSGPEANTFSGDILYVENVQKVTKNLDQIEDIKIILDF